MYAITFPSRAASVEVFELELTVVDKKDFVSGVKLSEGFPFFATSTSTLSDIRADKYFLSSPMTIILLQMLHYSLN